MPSTRLLKHQVPADAKGPRIAQLVVQEEWVGNSWGHSCFPTSAPNVSVFSAYHGVVLPRKRGDTPLRLTILGFISWVTDTHGDCVLKNFIMDANAMYPKGFHPIGFEYKSNYS